MTQEILLGYVVGTGEAVFIPLRHTAVTGQTQESGKTTTLEGLISRSGLQAIAYVTKRGESSFHVAQPIPPYFQERADWEFVQSLLEASTESKLKFERAWIMRAAEGAKTLADVQANIQRFVHGVRDKSPVKLRKGAEPKERWLQKPARGLSGDVYYVLSKYLADIMPELAAMPYTTRLDLSDGLNVMDLRDYDFPLQALVVRSVTEFIGEHLENTINIIPEAWKFAPKQRGSPVRLAAETYIREAAAMKNFLWIDSQDLAGVADVLMRQVGVWLFGVQRAKHEIERALDHMPEGLPARRPRPADIATLSKGQFYVCFGREMHKVYVQPAWMTAAHAEAIARGEEEVDSAREILKEYDKHGSNKRAPLATANVRSSAAEGFAKSEVVSVSAMREPSEAGRSASAPDWDSQRGGDPANTAEAEEAMWKEKYEALKKQFDALIDGLAAEQRAAILRGEQVIDVTPGRAPGPKHGANGNPEVWDPRDMDALLAALLRRAEKEPIILQILREHPEIEVKRKRIVIQKDHSSLDGRLAGLISEGFFKTPKTPTDAFRELIRIGYIKPGANKVAATVAREIKKLAEMGFLHFEENGYQAVPGMKINIVEA